ncbi:MAG: PASTA domain-containing protein [Bacteroidales bacterium]|nr:PASTA domain-containing protein [Bacteroidales bacterium]
MLKKIGIIVLNLVVMLLIVLGGTLLWIPGWLNDLTGHDNRVVVPSVIGQVADSAVLRLTDAGLNPMVIDTVYSDGRQPGEVIDQLPEGNLPVKPHRIVYLTINAFDVQKVVFPDVIQWSSRQAQSYLRELRFVADSIVYEPYDFDDLVLSVTALKGRKKEMEVGELYPVRTHVVLHVGSTKTAMEAQNEATEKSFFE